MSKKRIDISERDTSAGQSLGDFLNKAGLHASNDAPDERIEPKNVPKQKQAEPLHIRIEKKGRKGKVVTIISGFTGLTGVIEELARKLKSQCGVGGSVKDREIVMQGDLRKKIGELLRGHGYRVKG